MHEDTATIKLLDIRLLVVMGVAGLRQDHYR